MANNHNEQQNQKNEVLEATKKTAKNIAAKKMKKVGLLAIKKASIFIFSKFGIILLCVVGIILLAGLIVALVTPNMTTSANTNKEENEKLTKEYLERNAELTYKYNILDIRFPLMLTMGKQENEELLDISVDETVFMLYDLNYEEYIPALQECTFYTEIILEDGTVTEIPHTEILALAEAEAVGDGCVQIADRRTLMKDVYKTKEEIITFMIAKAAITILGDYPKREFVVNEGKLYSPLSLEEFATVGLSYLGTPLEEAMAEWEFTKGQEEHIEIIREIPDAVDELFNLHSVSMVGSHIGNGAYCIESSGTSVSAIATILDSTNKLKDYEHSFINVANQYNLDVALMVSIAVYLSENGNSEALTNHNNIEGLFDSTNGTIHSYNSIEEGITAFGRSLNRHINQSGNKTIESLGKIYTVSDGNNIPSSWASNIGLSVSKLGGLTKNCTSYSESTIIFDGDVSETRQKIASVGTRWIGNSRYVFGGGRNQNDIARGYFDCSSFVHWAYAQVGINLGNLTSTSTETLNKMGTRISINEIQVGDIIFWDSYKKDGHVGIYIGNGKFIGAQSSTGVAIVSVNDRYWSSIFSGHVRRLIN